MSGTRTPAARLPNVGAAVTAADLAAVLQWLRAQPLLDGRIVEFTTDGTGSATTVPHGLGRVYRGAFTVAVGDLSLSVHYATPENTEANGYDPARVVRIDPQGLQATTVRCWVF